MSKQCKDCEEAADLLRAEGRWAIDGAISILESGVVSDTVTIPRAEYERLLWLTTTKTIETAPRDKSILVKGNDVWIEALFNPHFNEFMTCDEFAVYKTTHWLPLPTTAKPKLDDADDALER